MITATSIPGLMLVDLDLRGDNRGWFKENWQREKMTAAGLPDFGPVQNNISFNDAIGTTRGIHAEPWDKFVSLGAGRIFGAWVDMREGPTFGAVFTATLDPSRAIFVPRGVGNAYQTLEAGTVYAYLVNEHWSPDATYSFLNLADATVGIEWPIPLSEAELSEKDRAHPQLADVTPIPPLKVLVIGADGQVGRALRTVYGEPAYLEYTTRATLDLADPGFTTARRWNDYGVIINAAAYTAVDAAETPAGRSVAWQVNAHAPAQLARIATEHGIILVHISSDYVYDGSAETPYLEDDSISPLGVYGQSKAAGDLAVGTVPRHYIVRTSWVIGDGMNFVRTMAALAARGVSPTVVDDQTGRLTFAIDIARGIRHLLDTDAPYGTYNLTGTGEPQTWAGIARNVYELTGHDPHRVVPVTTDAYYAQATDPVAPRPRYSALDVTKIEQAGASLRDVRAALEGYLAEG